MRKKEIIKYLQDEVGFLNVTEDENEDGELYITEAKFKEIDEIIKVLEEKKNLFEKKSNVLIEKIKLGEGDYVNISKKCLKDKSIKSEKDIIFLEPKQLYIINTNFFCDLMF